MWVEFSYAVIFILLVLYLPACLFVRAFGESWLKSFAIAPVIAVFGYSVLAIIYAKAGIPASVPLLVFPLVLIEILFFVSVALIRRFRSNGPSGYDAWDTGADWAIWACYIVVAVVVALYFYIGTLDSSASFPQDSDNTWHLSLINSFARSGNFSCLEASLFQDYRGLDIVPIMPIEFRYYPAAWHMLAAMCVLQFSVPVSVAANALNMAVLIMVLPSNIWLMMKVIFKDNNKIVLIGSLLALAFAVYPWGLLHPLSGPVYPNFIGNAFVPVVMALFIGLFNNDDRVSRFARVVLFAIALCSLVFLHANAVFTAATLLVPFCIYMIIKKTCDSDLGNAKKFLVAFAGCIVFCIIVSIVWVLLFNAAFATGVSSYEWAPYADPQQELLNILTLAIKRPNTQILLSCIVLIGIVYSFFERKYLWISASYLIACGFCFISATASGFLKSLLTGFWYTDAYRLAAMVAIVAIPLAAMGLYGLIRLFSWLMGKIMGATPKKVLTAIFAAALLGLFAVDNYYLIFDEEHGNENASGLGDFYISSGAANNLGRPNLFDEDEKEFVSKVAEVVDPQYAIYNNADDGSSFAYAFNNLNLVFRRSAAHLLDGGETAQSMLLRSSIDELATNEEVQKALKDANVKYILDLDLGGELLPERCYYGYYTASKWEGMSRINDNTPGLKVILSEGDMRLYEIDYDSFSQ